MAKEVILAAGNIGIAEKTLSRAAEGLGVIKTKLVTHWEWSLPQDGQDSQKGPNRGGGHLDLLDLQ